MKQETINGKSEGAARVGSSALLGAVLKYGGVTICAIAMYVMLFWLVPMSFEHPFRSVIITHGAAALFLWALYGLGAFDGDP